MKTCCLIVTYNRKNLVSRCIEKCLNQDVNPDIFIYDNASTDGTEELLEKGFADNPRVTYYRAKENKGGAGGFYAGMKKCYEAGYDFIWLLDDDGYPENSICLSECIRVYHKVNGNAIVNAFVYSKSDGVLSFKIFGCKTLNDIEEQFGNTDILYGGISPFNGTLVSRGIIEHIGYPKPEFFISGDEAEYTLRAHVNGIQLVTARNALFYHPSAVFLKKLSIRNTPVWRVYCTSRNYAYINKTYGGRRTLVKSYLKGILKCGLYKDQKMKKLQATIAGIHDGKRNIFQMDKIMKYRNSEL